jgi:hypothetical protein
MNEPTLQAQIDAARAYEELFVPALFGQWAPKVADAAQLRTVNEYSILGVAQGFLRVRPPRESDRRDVWWESTPVPECLQWLKARASSRVARVRMPGGLTSRAGIQ